jgi:hypothetical protein
MNKLINALSIVAVVLVLSACNRSEFNLPPGNAEVGRATFVLLQCNECHSVEGVQYAGSGFHSINVSLGGQTTKVKTYTDLVTSIINPSHKISRGDTGSTVTEDGTSMMRSYNETMTVEELTNLVTFLESKYEVWVPNYYQYPAP